MANAKPYLTTDDLIASIKRRISFPLSQNTFQYSDLVAFLNEEMQLSAVPTVKEEHEEYFVYKQTVELVTGVSRYEIPYRAIGMALRDVKYSDSSGNFYDMTRIAPDDKAFFQQSNGSNQTVSKYYLEGNELVLTPLVQAGASGKLNFFIFLRPNALVKNDRAAFINHFEKNIVVSNNSNIQPGDKILITTGPQTPTPVNYYFTAVNSSAQTISSVSIAGIVTTANAHNLPLNESFSITLSGVSTVVGEADINGTYDAISISANEFSINLPSIATPRTGGSYSVKNQFVIDATANNTAANLRNAISSVSIPKLVATVATNTINITYYDIGNGFNALKGLNNTSSSGFTIDNQNLSVSFTMETNGVQTAGFKTDYINPETQQTEALFGVNKKVDFLQTNPGHRTYTYDVDIVSIDGAVAKFPISQLQTYLNNSSGGVLAFYNIKVGDYVCLANECIIPQIPPELHSALAERAASRVLAAIGDVQGYQISMAKIQEMDKKQETLIGSRVEGSVPKVFNRYSLLRLGKSRFRRRY
jgi:hypothetical protein